MIDQSNRAGRAPTCNVFKNRRRNPSGTSPGPSPVGKDIFIALGDFPVSELSQGYSPDAVSAPPMSMPYPAPADLYNMQRTMFPTASYAPFPTP